MKWSIYGPRARQIIWAFLFTLLLGSLPQALGQFEIKGGVFNNLSQRLPSVGLPTGPPGLPTGPATTTPQFSNMVEASGVAIRTQSGGYPKGGAQGVTLSRAAFGSTFASGVPRYLLGDQIIPPASITDSSGKIYSSVDPSYWRAQPVLAGEAISNPEGNTGAPIDFKTGARAAVPPLVAGAYAEYYYSPHAKRVFANTPGSVEITWRSEEAKLPDGTSTNSYVFYKERFSVSSASGVPVRNIYWTEKSFSAPLVNITSGKVSSANPIFSRIFPGQVAKEFEVPGLPVGLGTDEKPILRTLWYENTKGYGALHAYNFTGRVLVEYLGAYNPEEGTYEFIGADIVDVQQTLKPSTLKVELGREIRPSPEDLTLLPLPVSASALVNQLSYYGTSVDSNGLQSYFAEQENTVEDNVAFYWMEQTDVGIPNDPLKIPGCVISWPKNYHKYLQSWPANIQDFAHYSVDNGGSSLDNGIGLKFGSGRVPQVIHQDSSRVEASIDNNTQRLLVNLSSSNDQKNRSLLKFYGSNGGVWYVPLMTQAEDRASYEEGDGLPALTKTAYVGERLLPPSSRYTYAGYISSGTSYSPNAYIDPFVNGIPAAETGAIIPVNAPPGDQSQLTVWWFKKVSPPSAEFDAFYTPAKIGRYNVEYRTTTELASEDFATSAAGWSVPTWTETPATGGYLGPFAVYADNSTRNIAATSKSFNLPGNIGDGPTISFKLRRVGTWDSERFTTFINGTQVIDTKFDQTEVVETRTGAVISGGVNYSWTIAPVKYEAPTTTTLEGGTQTFLATIVARPGSASAASSLTTLDIGFGSNLDSPASDEFFGIDDVAIQNPLPRIVLASRLGTRSLPQSVAAGTIYRQPDPGRPGYNPNEEHALKIGSVAYALRDDLNVTTAGAKFSSLPRVLIEYKNAVDKRPAMSVFEVVREDSVYTLNYKVFAGTRMDAVMPAPLGTLPLPQDLASGEVMNKEVGSDREELTIGTLPPSFTDYSVFTFRDRKGYDWVYRGPSQPGNPSLRMQFYYNMQATFDFPAAFEVTTPAVGKPLPYLRQRGANGTFLGDVVTGPPASITYSPTWPNNPPVLSVAETLALAKNGLPAVRGQTSARVLYQESIAIGGPTKASVVLHDATRAKSIELNSVEVGLDKLPASLKTSSRNGKTYFQLAPPHLQQRFYFDPLMGNIGGLKLVGEFVPAIAGEKYLHLNALSPADALALKGLVISEDSDKSKWDNAIDGLSTRVETFKQDPQRPGVPMVDSPKNLDVGARELPEVIYSNTAVDSYALTATGKGSGYVTLLFGDGISTPVGNGVDMKIIKVEEKLYNGELKTLPASNPLDEQVTLRHSGDFAARPDDYDFEWYYLPSSGGGAPATDAFSNKRVIGATTPASDAWHLITDPISDPSPVNPLEYPATPVETLPKSYPVNSSTYNIPGRPGRLFKSVNGLAFTGSTPDKVYFSVEMGDRDGFVLYVNGAAALAWQIPFGSVIPGNIGERSARTGLVQDGLRFQFEVEPAYFKLGDNRLEVALYSPNGPNSPSNNVDFRVQIPVKNELVTTNWIRASDTPLSNSITIGGSANSIAGNTLLVFSDNFFTMRYKPKQGTGNVASEDVWSDWSAPVVVESWMKRLLAGINPFNQRQRDLYNNQVNTDVSVLQQAGKRSEGDVALNLDNINDYGLIEIYETALNRVKSQSIDAGVSSPAVNQTLQLAAGYLSDLYMILGNEASDDAQNPSLMLDSSPESSEVSSSRFSFEGQVSSVMEETLGLLRGRDDFGTSTTIAPAYNRFIWNYTRGIRSGEPIYAANYGITEKSGSVNADGVVDASDAQAMFPQGHGDAYGHYLSALKGYYKLLTNDTFTWETKSEMVSLLGQTVSVDYQDERKFAKAAAALAKTGLEILELTASQNHEDTERNGWGSFTEKKFNATTGKTREWGLDQWASRTAQGSYYNWVTANAMLPDKDMVNEGVSKIDRTTVPELDELVSASQRVLSMSSGLQAHLNPLGLATNAVSFDISPVEVAAGKYHFEQLYARAVRASINAKNAFHHAGKMNRQLRAQHETVDEFNDAVSRQESAYVYQLINLYGTPYEGDIGPGKLYRQGYAGPDIYHYYIINRPSPIVDTESTVSMTFREPINWDPFQEWTLEGPNSRLNNPPEFINRTYTISKSNLVQFSDTVSNGLGRRQTTGEIQTALLEQYEAQVNVRNSSRSFSTLMNRFNRDYQLYTEYATEFDVADNAASALSDEATSVRNAAFALTSAASAAGVLFEYIGALGEATAEVLPTAIGLSADVTAPARGAIRISAETLGLVSGLVSLTSEIGSALLEMKAANLDADAEALYEEYGRTTAAKKHIVELERLYDEVLATGYDITSRLAELQRASENVARILSTAAHLQTEIETFRKRTAAVIQGFRTRDVVYRDLRNEELAQYKSLFDLARTFTYLAAKAYDYETGTLHSDEGSKFIESIVGAYSVGDFEGDRPLISTKGDVGLAGILGRLDDDWSVLKNRGGFNNPERDGTVFSLRQELFRIPTDKATDDDVLLWKQVLQQHIMSNLLNDPDAARFCKTLAKSDKSPVPGFMIPFSTSVEQGMNFFGWPLNPGDHNFTKSSSSTKIAAVGLVFSGYIGMDPLNPANFGAGGPASAHPDAMSASPYAYLIPAGYDIIRNTLNDEDEYWTVRDQAIPLPRNLGASEFSGAQLFTPDGSLNENRWITRRHGAVRVVNDPAYFYTSTPTEFTNSRLIGRSVYNTKWKLIIPAYYLLNNEQDALDRFTRSVSDIKLFMRTYSNSGN